MKLVIASDIHGSAYWCGKLVEVIEEVKPDKFFFWETSSTMAPGTICPRAMLPSR